MRITPSPRFGGVFVGNLQDFPEGERETLRYVLGCLDSHQFSHRLDPDTGSFAFATPDAEDARALSLIGDELDRDYLPVMRLQDVPDQDAFRAIRANLETHLTAGPCENPKEVLFPGAPKREPQTARHAQFGWNA